MKKLYFSICALSVMGIMNAQHTITSANLPAVGDTFLHFMATNPAGVTPGGTGTGQTWNFSTVAVNSLSGIMSYVTPASTPMASDFPNSTVAENDSANYSFYRLVGGTSWQSDGMEITASGITARAIFTDQAVIYNAFPYGVGSTTPSDAVTGNITGSLTGTLTGTSNAACEGSGTLMLPGGTYTNVIRIRDSLHFTFNLTSPLPATGSYYQTRYSYFGAASKFPLFEIRTTYINTSIGGTTTVKEVFVNGITYVGIPETKNAISFNLFPNPAKNELNIKMNLQKQNNFSVEVINQLGQVVKSEKMENINAGTLVKKIDLTGVASGIYFVRLKNSEFSKVQKFIVE